MVEGLVNYPTEKYYTTEREQQYITTQRFGKYFFEVKAIKVAVSSPIQVRRIFSPLAVGWWDLVTGKVHKSSVSKRCFTLLPLVIWMKIKIFLKSLEKQPFSLPIK